MLVLVIICLTCLGGVKESGISWYICVADLYSDLPGCVFGSSRESVGG